MYEGNESDASLCRLDVWTQAFESIKYYNSKEVDAEEGETLMLMKEQMVQMAQKVKMTLKLPQSLGERTILFSLGPLHVESIEMGIIIFMNFMSFLLDQMELLIQVKIYTIIKIEE